MSMTIDRGLVDGDADRLGPRRQGDDAGARKIASDAHFTGHRQTPCSRNVERKPRRAQAFRLRPGSCRRRRIHSTGLRPFGCSRARIFSGSVAGSPILPITAAASTRIALGDAELGAGAVEVDARHAVGVIAHPGRLQRQAGPGGAGVEAVAVRDALLARLRLHQAVGQDEDQDRGAVRPALVPGDEEVEETRPIRVAAMRVEDAPGLGVERRRRPSRRLEDGEQVVLRHGRAVEGARRPALEEERIDRVVGRCGRSWRISCEGDAASPVGRGVSSRGTAGV